MQPRIIPEVAELLGELIEDRRHFHRHPELSFKEFKTAEYITEKLRVLGLDVYEKCGRTGVVGVLWGAKPGPCIGLRADMDALPLPEAKTEFNKDYRSANEGVHHACGHDGHMAILLTAAKAMTSRKSTLCGSVKFMFQPAEEGLGGGKAMIEDGVLEEGKFGPKVDQVYGLHLWNYLPVGTFGVTKGPMMASSDRFDIAVKGHGGHGAIPHSTKDSIVAAAQLVVQLNTVVSRNISPLESAVLTVGTINGGYNYNIIADLVELSGTVRVLSKEDRETMVSRVTAICDGVSASFGVKCELNYKFGYPVLVNSNEAALQTTRAAATQVLGGDKVQYIKATMGAEDFSYFLEERPGCFFFLGSGRSSGPLIPHHISTFDLDEGCLPIGSSIFVNLVQSLLGEPKSKL